MYKIFIPESIKKVAEDYLEDNGYEIVRGNGINENDLIEGIKECDAAIIRTAKVTENVINSAKKLKIIARHGAGYDGVDIKAAKNKNIVVVNAPGANSISVAELTIFYILYCSRQFGIVKKKLKEDYMIAKLGIEKHEISNKILGLIGTGNIGNKVAEMAKYGFNMNIIAYDPYVKEENKLDFIEYKSREEVIRQSDYLSLHMPLTEDTKDSISKDEFKNMKSNAYLINTARGGLVDEDALYSAIKNKLIKGAALDTVKNEPNIKGNKLFELDNILIAPHIGAATEEATIKSSLICAKSIDKFLKGEYLDNIVPELR